MDEKLIITNFAGMKNVQLNFNRLNLIIGSQATGKSVCAKLFYYFKNIFSELANTIIEKKTNEEYELYLVKKFKKFFHK